MVPWVCGSALLLAAVGEELGIEDEGVIEMTTPRMTARGAVRKRTDPLTDVEKAIHELRKDCPAKSPKNLQTPKHRRSRMPSMKGPRQVLGMPGLKPGDEIDSSAWAIPSSDVPCVWLEDVASNDESSTGESISQDSSPGEGNAESYFFSDQQLTSSQSISRRSLMTHTMGAHTSGSCRLCIESEEKIEMLYDLENISSTKGAFGRITRAMLRTTGAIRGVETVNKEQLKGQKKLFKKELGILKMIDHPNLMMLHEFFEDNKQIHLVMQLCSGGNVSEYVKRAGPLREVQAAAVMKQVLRAISYLHKNRICHRDVKAENCLIVSGRRIERSTVKLGGYTAADILKPGQRSFTKSVGTLTHMAPEVLKSKYGFRCDLWSAGIMLHGMISLSLPFMGETDDDLRENILKRKPALGREMVNVSQLALDFLDRLLVKEPKQRCSAKQALADSWIEATAPKLDRAPISQGVLKKVFKLRRRSSLQQAVLHILTSMLPEAELEVSRNFFILLDRDGDGLVSMAEIQSVLGERMPSVHHEADQSALSYTEFLAATLDVEKQRESKLFKDIFDSFDRNGDGTLSISELSTGDKIGALSVDELAREMAKVDRDGDSKLDFAEFHQMMKVGMTKQLSM